MIGINNLFNLFNNKYLVNDIFTVVTSHEFVITHNTVRGVLSNYLKTNIYLSHFINVL